MNLIRLISLRLMVLAQRWKRHLLDNLVLKCFKILCIIMKVSGDGFVVTGLWLINYDHGLSNFWSCQLFGIKSVITAESGPRYMYCVPKETKLKCNYKIIMKGLQLPSDLWACHWICLVDWFMKLANLTKGGTTLGYLFSDHKSNYL